MAPLTIYCDADLGGEAAALLVEGTRAHRLLRPAQGRTRWGSRGRPDPLLDGAEVAFGQPDAVQVMASASLRWLQITSAGYTAYDSEPFRAALRARGAVMTKSSAVYDEPCAEHVLAFMLADARQLPAAWANQAGDRGWPVAPMRGASRLLLGQRAVLFGYGAIARRLAELLSPFRMSVVGVRRRPAPGEPVPVVALGDPAADEALAAADHVVDILPASAETVRFFDDRRLARCKPGAVFYNIGRGATVDQEALAAALRAGRLRAAYLDVTDPEPLPSEHPLWTTPGCFITPHTGGGHADEHLRLVRHFLENLRRFEDGAPLEDRVF